MIYTHDQVRAAVARALLANPLAGTDAAMVAAAAALCLPPDTVRGVIDFRPELEPAA